ncbi:hypothetical protein ACFLRT_01050 [Acidobacteriota bacterium]
MMKFFIKEEEKNRKSILLNIIKKVKPDVIFLILCLPLIFIGVNNSWDVEWPDDLDHSRDIAQTQTILDGYYGSDPYYLNEYIWYNPGYHFVIAGLSLLLNIGVPATVIKMGPFLNLFPLIAFYVMVRIMFDWETALVSTMAYLFLTNTSYPLWVSSLYSPWSYPSTFSQAFFYITIGLFYRALKKDKKTKSYIIIGILLGVTFLFHASPAMIALGVITLCLLWEIVVKLKSHELTIHKSKILLKKFLCIVIPTLILSMIFLYFMVWHYRLKIVNPLPGSWQWPQLTLESLPVLLQKELLQILTLIAAFGLIHWVMVKKDIAAKKILLSWLLVCVVWAGYSVLKSNITMLTLLPSVPIHHFYFYLKALAYIFFGFGIVSIFRLSWKVLKNNRVFIIKFNRHLLNQRFQWKAELIFCIIAVVILSVYIVFAYPLHKDVVETRIFPSSRIAQNYLIDAYNWIRQNTGNDDVFLCNNQFSMKVVAPAARKVVVTHGQFSNPFVDFDERNEDRNRMIEDMKSGDLLSFHRLCQKYKTKYVIGRVALLLKTHRYIRKYLKQVLGSGNVMIARIKFPKVLPPESQLIRE